MRRLKTILKILSILTFWFIFISLGQPTFEWWVVFYEDENSIHKCHRTEYLEMRDLIENPISDIETDTYYYIMWEPYVEEIREWIHEYGPKIDYGILKELENKKGN
jgi:hypothetical protein